MLEYRLRGLPRLLNLDSRVGETGNSRFGRAVAPMMHAAGVTPIFENDDGTLTFSRTQMAQFLATKKLPFDGWVSMGEVVFFDPGGFLRYQGVHHDPKKQGGGRERNPYYWASHDVRKALAGLPVRRLIFG